VAVSWHVDRADTLADRWANDWLTCVLIWETSMVPRGPVMGCHMAPLHWLLWKNCMDSTAVKLLTSGLGGVTWKDWATSPLTVLLVNYNVKHLFELNWVFRQRSKGSGLGPSPRSSALHMTHTLNFGTDICMGLSMFSLSTPIYDIPYNHTI
jgi:hypothetical protein